AGSILRSGARAKERLEAGLETRFVAFGPSGVSAPIDVLDAPLLPLQLAGLLGGLDAGRRLERRVHELEQLGGVRRGDREREHRADRDDLDAGDALAE